jgi:hypothetical protein
MKKQLSLLFLLHFTFCILHSSAQTNVSGFINANTTWTLAGSPYIVVGNALVSQGYTLTIQPGVVIKFDSAKALQIDGELIAIGTAANRITFTSNQMNPQRGDWAKLHFSSYATEAVYDIMGNYMSGSIMKYCDVFYAGGLGYGGIHIENSAPYFSKCNLKYSASSGIYCTSTSYIIDSTVVSDNTGYGLAFYQLFSNFCGLFIREDTLQNNSNGGIYLESESQGCGIEIKNNYFISNGLEGGINSYYVTRNLIITNNYFLNNSSTLKGIISFTEYTGYQNIEIKDNYFEGNVSDKSTVWFLGNSTYISISKNIFNNNSSNQGVIGFNSFTGGDTISCNRFINNQTTKAVLKLPGALYAASGEINYNIFDGNIISTNNETGIIEIGQNTGELEFSNNVIRNNLTTNGKLCFFYANVDDTLQNLRVHHNEFFNNTAKTIICIAGQQINNSNRDFLYLQYNNFLDTSNLYVIYDSIPYGSPNFMIGNNYWGTMSTSYIDSAIYDYFDNANRSVVYYLPLLGNMEFIDTLCPQNISTFVPEIKPQHNSFLIYPNLTQNTFTISFNEWTSDNGQLTIFDLTGRVVYEKAFLNAKYQILNTDFSPGVYFVKVSDGEQRLIQKLVIE